MDFNGLLGREWAQMCWPSEPKLKGSLEVWLIITANKIVLKKTQILVLDLRGQGLVAG